MQNNRNTAGHSPAQKCKTPTTGQTVARAIDQHNGLDCATGQRPDKAFSTLRAALALRGHQLYRTDERDGSPTYLAERFGHVRYMHSLDEVHQFLHKIEGAL